jgi:hypothetical protein
MNRWIAGVFASIVSFIHWGVLIFMIVVALIIFENKNAYYTTILGYNFTKEMSFIFLIAFFIGYVLVMGFLSTIIAINQNIERLNAALDRLKGG